MAKHLKAEIEESNFRENKNRPSKHVEVRTSIETRRVEVHLSKKDFQEPETLHDEMLGRLY